MRCGVARRLFALVLLFGGSYTAHATSISQQVCAAANLAWGGFQHITVFALCVLALAAVLFFRRSRGRMERLKQQKNELALAVMLRTREIEEEKKTIECQKEQIEELLGKAQQSSRLKDEFLANISHEIRTPLHGILGMTELALSTTLTPEQRDYLELAGSSAQSLLALVNDILDFSKIESGHFELACISFCVRDCIQGAIGAFPLSARTKGLGFIARIDDSVPEIMEGDPVRFRQILVNLIGNAIKFTEAGSVSVEVSAETNAAGRINLQLLCVRVTDTGIGIPDDKQEDIFEPFRQVDGSATRKYGGTGLGLAISTRLARDMHGSLTVQSKEGRGSTFILKLPLSLSAARAVNFTEEAQSLQLTA